MSIAEHASGSGRRVRIDFEHRIAADLAGEIHKKIYYLSEDIVDFSLVRRGDEVVGVDLTVRDSASHAELVDYLRRTINADVRGIKQFKPRRVWDHDAPWAGRRPPLFEELQARDLIHVHGEGQVGIRGPLLDLFQFFDSLVRVVGQRLFQAEAYQFPTLVRTAVLNRAGYLDWFPHFLMFVTRMKNDLRNFDKFKAVRQGWGDGATFEGLRDLTCETGYNAPPTMCYYVYDTLHGRAFDRNMAATTVGKVFRYENKYHDPLTRLWDFTMREIVFLGSAEYVKASVETCREIMTGFMERMGLRGVCETANDPFFLASQTPLLINAQLLTGAKHELRLRVGPEQTVAVASFNLHGQFIAKRFDLQAMSGPDDHIFTGCFAVGLERLLFAVLAQLGVDPAGWPEMFHEHLEADRERARLLEGYARATRAGSAARR
jgi:hypothetical protein